MNSCTYPPGLPPARPQVLEGNQVGWKRVLEVSQELEGE